ncbi:hypothetical protein U1Q18_039633 [Sarracenia purpurea var. burkii]
MEKPSWVLKMKTMEKRAGAIWRLGPREQVAARGSAQWLRARDDDGREQQRLLSPERCADARGAHSSSGAEQEVTRKEENMPQECEAGEVASHSRIWARRATIERRQRETLLRLLHFASSDWGRNQQPLSGRNQRRSKRCRENGGSMKKPPS